MEKIKSPLFAKGFFYIFKTELADKLGINSESDPFSKP